MSSARNGGEALKSASRGRSSDSAIAGRKCFAAGITIIALKPDDSSTNYVRCEHNWRLIETRLAAFDGLYRFFEIEGRTTHTP